MIRTEIVSHIPRDVLGCLRMHGRMEYERAGSWRELAERESHFIWRADVDRTPLAVFGIVKPDQIGPYMFWLLLCEGFTAKHLRQSAVQIKELLAPVGLMHTHIAEDFFVGRRFAEFFGFRPLNNKCFIMGVLHRTYEARY